ncbi:MAG: PIN domain-containing protein, partial [Methylococcaceae bacterium]|nr:PIN domain-containing protein [Methylococcaceae bacterium]
KKKFVASVNIHQDEILEILYQLIRHIDFYDENSISVNALKNAWELVKDVDPKDMLFVALTLELNGLLWTGDNKLRAGLKNKGFDAFFETN